MNLLGNEEFYGGWEGRSGEEMRCQEIEIMPRNGIVKFLRMKKFNNALKHC